MAVCSLVSVLYFISTYLVKAELEERSSLTVYVRSYKITLTCMRSQYNELHFI